MKYNCDIVKDLLPLYHDEVCSEASKQVVEEHVEECVECDRLLKRLNNTVAENLLEEEATDIIKHHVKKEQKHSFIVGTSSAAV